MKLSLKEMINITLKKTIQTKKRREMTKCSSKEENHIC